MRFPKLLIQSIQLPLARKRNREEFADVASRSGDGSTAGRAPDARQLKQPPCVSSIGNSSLFFDELCVAPPRLIDGLMTSGPSVVVEVRDVRHRSAIPSGQRQETERENDKSGLKVQKNINDESTQILPPTTNRHIVFGHYEDDCGYCRG